MWQTVGSDDEDDDDKAEETGNGKDKEASASDKHHHHHHHRHGKDDRDKGDKHHGQRQHHSSKEEGRGRKRSRDDGDGHGSRYDLFSVCVLLARRCSLVSRGSFAYLHAFLRHTKYLTNGKYRIAYCIVGCKMVNIDRATSIVRHYELVVETAGVGCRAIRYTTPRRADFIVLVCS